MLTLPLMETTKLQAQNVMVNILTSSQQRLFNTLKEINMALRRTKLDLVFLCLRPLKDPFVAAFFQEFVLYVS